jgi:disulfide bond formation protein DsbB
MSPNRDAALVILTAAITALSAVMIAQYGFGLLPCPLCIYQRVPYGVVALLALLMQQPRLGGGRIGAALLALCAATFAVGGGIALYHVGVEQHWWAGPATCSGGIGAAASIEDLISQLSKPIKIPACDQIAWSLFGVSMAGYNLLASVGLCGFAGLAAQRGWRATR